MNGDLELVCKRGDKEDAVAAERRHAVDAAAIEARGEGAAVFVLFAFSALKQNEMLRY